MPLKALILMYHVNRKRDKTVRSTRIRRKGGGGRWLPSENLKYINRHDKPYNLLSSVLLMTFARYIHSQMFLFVNC